MAVILTSTTEPQENLDHGVSDDWRKPPEPKPAEEVPQAGDETPAETAAAEETAEPQESEKPKRKGGYQRTIEKQNRRIQELESRLAEREQAAKPAEQAGNAPKPATGEPKWEEYQASGKTMENFLNDRDSWREGQDRNSAIAERRMSLVKDYNEAMIALENEHDDFDDVLKSANIPVTQDVSEALIQMGAAGPEVVYGLAQNPEFCEELLNMTPHEQVMAVKEFALGMKKAAKESPESSPEKKQRPAPPKPLEGRTVSSGSTQSVVSIYDDHIDQDTFNRIRRDQTKRRGR